MELPAVRITQRRISASLGINDASAHYDAKAEFMGVSVSTERVKSKRHIFLNSAVK